MQQAGLCVNFIYWIQLDLCKGHSGIFFEKLIYQKQNKTISVSLPDRHCQSKNDPVQDPTNIIEQVYWVDDVQKCQLAGHFDSEGICT